jgi:CopA family copper-resistance protein
MISRRLFLTHAATLGALAALQQVIPACAPRGAVPTTPPALQRGEVIDLILEETSANVNGRLTTGLTINGTIPGPLIRLQEGQHVTLHVTNRLHELSSLHWHGILLPPGMDGVPGVSFGGIKPGTTFVYRFLVRQSGTYWYHSHSGLQELLGLYAPIIIDPVDPDPFPYDREHVVLLSEWTFQSPETLFANLKKVPGLYNYQKRTVGEFVSNVKAWGLWRALGSYLSWDLMRMDPTDFADITSAAFVYLINGRSPAENWTGLFHPGERIRLRFINAATMTFYDVRIPGLEMTIVQADGQNVEPVATEEFRLGPGETYDVLVEPRHDDAYTIFAETLDRSGYARGTLATRPGMAGEIPPRRPRPLRTMADMGMSLAHGAHNSGGSMPNEHSGMGAGEMSGATPPTAPRQKTPHMDSRPYESGTHSDHLIANELPRHSPIPGSDPVKHGPHHHGLGNQTVATYSRNRIAEPGAGLNEAGWRVLTYTALRSIAPYPDQGPPEREIELHVTGNMQRYMWSFDGKKYSDAKAPIPLRHGERVRLTFVNDTMMEHPLHLHGMWMYLENGQGAHLPRKHTVAVKPAERVSVVITADAPGPWAFHCHLLLHMEAGMFRVFQVFTDTDFSVPS